MMGSLLRRLGCAFVLVLVAGGCGADSMPSSTKSSLRTDRLERKEKAWLELLARSSLRPDKRRVVMEVKRDEGRLAIRPSAPPEIRKRAKLQRLRISISLPPHAEEEIFLPDSTFGLNAYSYGGGRWRRMDPEYFALQRVSTLVPFGKARRCCDQYTTLRTGLGVRRARSYRVLLRGLTRGGDKFAAWTDS